MKRIFIFTLLVTMFTACMQDSITEVDNKSPKQKCIYATFEEDTRVELNEKKQTVWTEGDQIVRFGNGIYDVWNFTGKTGDRGGSFEFWGAWEYSVGYDFGDKIYALYPYANYYACYFFNDTGEPALIHNVRAEQNYKPNTYDPVSNIMLGASDDGKNFVFQNLMGHLRLSLTGDKCVSHITLTGNNNEVINGLRYFRFNNFNESYWYDSLTSTTTLRCNDVQLTDTPTEFYFTLAPTYFGNGISVEVHFTDGTMYPIRTTKEVLIERNTIQPMANVNTGNEIEWQTILIEHSGSVVATPVLYGYTNLVGYTYWGDGFMTPISDVVSSYVYDDGLDKHDITVKSQNATYLYIKSCEGISEIDLSNF